MEAPEITKQQALDRLRITEAQLNTLDRKPVKHFDMEGKEVKGWGTSNVYPESLSKMWNPADSDERFKEAIKEVIGEKKQMYFIGCGDLHPPISEQTTDKEFDYLIQIDELKKELSDTKLKLYEQKTHVSYHEDLLSWSSKEIERQADLIEKLKKHIGHINSLSD